MTNTQYATPRELSDFMGLTITYPDIDRDGDHIPLELVGTGDNSRSTFFTDKPAIFEGTYTFYHGLDEEDALSHPLEEPAHYSFDRDEGILTLTKEGILEVKTNNIYARYKCNAVGLTETDLQTVLNQSAKFVDDVTLTHFADSSATTPDWICVTNEKHRGKGQLKYLYSTDNYPIANLSTTLTVDIDSGDTAIAVDSTSGFPSNGYLTIGTDKIKYTGKTSTTFTGCSGITTTHTSGTDVYGYVVEISKSDRGDSVEWEVLEPDVDVDVDCTTGNIELLDESINEVSLVDKPQKLVPNRVRFTYCYGDELNENVKLLTLMVASQIKMNEVIRKAHMTGIDSFKPELVRVDDSEINKLISILKHDRTKNI